MRTKHRGRERSPAASTRQSADRRRGGDEYPHGGGGGNGGGRVLPAAYMTARDTARTVERGSDGSESDTMKTGRDMHTARGFETDDYISAAEQLSCRGGTGIFWKVYTQKSIRACAALGRWCILKDLYVRCFWKVVCTQRPIRACAALS